MAQGPRVVIIGGGGTGAAIAHDCVCRGYRVLLLEKGSLTSGTTGRHHGLLHSGARYAGGDPQAAAECWQESQILRRITHGVIEDNGGYFVAVRDLDDPEYAERFEAGCRRAGIPFRAAPPRELAAVAPALTERAAQAYAVPDASFDAWRLPMEFFTAALSGGAVIRQFCEVVGIEREHERVTAVRYIDYQRRREERVRCDVVVNASGIWAARVAALCSLSIEMHAQAGMMLSVRGRMCDVVLNRLAPAGDGDIIVPQRGQTIIGTTGYPCDNIDNIESRVGEVGYLQRRASELLPQFSNRAIHAVWVAARPLAGAARTGSERGQEGGGDDARRISRKLVCYNHASDGAAGMFSVIGGKATTLRAMAEKLVGMIAAHTGDSTECTTATRRLPSFQQFYAHYNATEHARNAKEWLR